MNIVVADILYPEGHKALMTGWLKILSKDNDVTLIGKKGYFDSVESDGQLFNKIKVKQFFSKRIEFIKVFLYVFNLFIVAIALRKIKYDKILFLSTHNAALYFVLPFFRRDSIVVVHHYDLDRTAALPFEKNLFCKYSNKIKHIVLAEFIADGLISGYNVREENVYVVYQPIIKKFDDIHKIRDNKLILLGRKYSEDFLNALIDLDKQSKKINRNKLLIRAKGINYSSPNIEVFDKYLNYEEYCSLLESSSACVVIYPDTYKLRYSGVMDDAICHGIYILSYDIPVGRYFKAICPNCVSLFSSAKELWKIADSVIPKTFEEELKNFIGEHSDSIIIKQFQRALAI